MQQAAEEQQAAEKHTTSPATGVILFGIYFYFQSQSGA
jgi:hypothetical protein